MRFSFLMDRRRKLCKYKQAHTNLYFLQLNMPLRANGEYELPTTKKPFVRAQNKATRMELRSIIENAGC